MRKFSNVKRDKKRHIEKNTQIDNQEKMKLNIIRLVDNLLRVNSFDNLTYEIIGKENLADAIIDLFKKDSLREKLEILNSLKLEVRDWGAIDNKIDSLKNLDSNKLKFQRMLERYDNDSLRLFTNYNVNKINNKQTLNDYKKLVESSDLDINVKNDLIQIYNNRIFKLNK